MTDPSSEGSRAVLITGCSTGIGRATAKHLAAAGWKVYASARRPESIADLRVAGCRTLALDVVDEDSIRAAVRTVEEEQGAVGVLVNNAGYSQSGAIEDVPIEEVRRQFETNVFGLVRLTQLVLPRMRAQRFGKIVNVGSMGGRLSFPGGGHYHATKHALEAIADSLRLELQQLKLRWRHERRWPLEFRQEARTTAVRAGGHTAVVRLDVDRLLEGLNPPQREAVTAGDGPLLVLAAAGYGLSRLVPAGTAHALTGSDFPIPVMGKTGTTSLFRDALFVGSTYGAQGITVAVWIGFDDNRSLGEKETGGRTALPIFREIMLRAYERQLVGPVPEFPREIEERIGQYLVRLAELKTAEGDQGPIVESDEVDK